MPERYRVVFLDIESSAAPLKDGEPVPRPARMVTVEGEAPGPYAAALRAWAWLAAAEPARQVFPGAYVIYSEPKLIASPEGACAHVTVIPLRAHHAAEPVGRVCTTCGVTV